MASRPVIDPPEIPGVTDLVAIGRGGFGVVYRGRQPEFGRDVAVKVLRADGADERSVERWRREVTAMGRLSNHPNIVAVYSAGVTDAGHPYLLMPHVGGGSLHDRIRASGPLPAAEAARLGAGVASGLAAAHAAGVLHRDVKPANVLLSEYGEPQLTDFGIARLVDATTTSTTSIHATIGYAPPEMLAGEAVTPAADVYGLGATLHAALAGQAPFVGPDGEPLAARIGRVMTQAPPDLRSVGVPPALAALVARTLAKAPDERPASADDLRQLLCDVDLNDRDLGDLGDVAPEDDPVDMSQSIAAYATAHMAALDTADALADTSESVPLSIPTPAVSSTVAPAVVTATVPLVGPTTAEPEPEPELDPAAASRSPRVGWFAAAAVLLVLVGLAAWALLAAGGDGEDATTGSSTTEAAEDASTEDPSPTTDPDDTPTSAPGSGSSTATPTPTTPPDAIDEVPTTSTTAPRATVSPTTAPPTTPSTTAPSTTVPPTTAPPTTAAPTTAPPTPTTEDPASSAAPPRDEAIRDAVGSYYATVDGGDLRSSYSRLSPGYQARSSFASYSRFWGGVDSVRVQGQPDVDPTTGRAEVTLRYDLADGTASTEVVEVTFVDGAGGLLIDNYRVLRAT